MYIGPKQTTGRIRKGPLAANPALWEALEDGALLRRALETFYPKVFEDPRLAPFFVDAELRHTIDKQYSFLRSIITGTGGYFGNRPKNAHHWMVIDDDLFDYRERLFLDTFRKAGLDETWVQCLSEINEVFRKQIVKAAPIPRSLAGAHFPLYGYDEMVMSVGTVCDACAEAIDEGQTARYHRRTGRTYCVPCTPPDDTPPGYTEAKHP